MLTEITLPLIKEAFEKYLKDSGIKGGDEWSIFKKYLLHSFKEKSIRDYTKKRKFNENQNSTPD